MRPDSIRTIILLSLFTGLMVALGVLTYGRREPTPPMIDYIVCIKHPNGKTEHVYLPAVNAYFAMTEAHGLYTDDQGIEVLGVWHPDLNS